MVLVIKRNIFKNYLNDKVFQYVLKFLALNRVDSIYSSYGLYAYTKTILSIILLVWWSKENNIIDLKNNNFVYISVAFFAINISLNITSIYCNICAIYLRRTEFVRLNTLLEITKGKLKKRIMIDHCYNDGQRLIFIFIVYMIFYIGLGIHAYIIFNRNVSIESIGTYIIIHHTYWSNLVFCNQYFEQIWRFKQLIILCNKQFCGTSPQVSLILSSHIDFLDLKQVIFLRNIFEDIFDLIELYNNTYGSQIIAQILCTALILLIRSFLIIQNILKGINESPLIPLYESISDFVLIVVSIF